MQQNTKYSAFGLATIFMAAFLFAGCSEKPAENTASKIEQKQESQAEQKKEPLSSEQEHMPADMVPDTNTVSKEDLEKFVFSDDFNSPEYFNMIQESAENIQVEIVNRELSKTKDVSVCQKIQNVSRSKSCENNFYYSKAKKDGDKELCAKISNERTAKSCKESVIFQSATKKEDVELCNELESPAVLQNCESTVYLAKARKDLDVEVCKSIPLPEYVQMCESEVRIMAEEKQQQDAYEAEMKKQQDALEAEINTENAE